MNYKTETENQSLIREKAIHLINQFTPALRKVYKKEGPIKFLRAIKERLATKPFYTMKEFKENPL